jgi:hypothetical protein
MKIVWNEIDRPAWNAMHAERLGSWQQDYAYGEAIRAIGGEVLRARIEDAGATVAIAQFTTRRFAGVLGLALCTRGPVWASGLDAGAKRAAYRLMKTAPPLARPRFLVFSPDEPAPGEGLDRLSRVMTGYSTVALDLDRPLEELRAGLYGKWRNRLVAAEKAALAYQAGGVKPAQYQWLLQRENEQRMAQGYKGLPVGLVEAFQAAKPDRREGLMIETARLGKDAAAAMMFLIHGQAATYHIGWSSDEGRAAGAHNALLWRAIEALKARGVHSLDLGGVDTAQGAGIARFKLGVGGRVLTLAGAFV